MRDVVPTPDSPKNFKEETMVSRILSTVAVLGLATSGTAKVKLETVNPSPAKNTIKLPMTLAFLQTGGDGQPTPPVPPPPLPPC